MNTFPHHVSESRVFAAGWKRQGSAGLFVFNKEGEGDERMRSFLSSEGKDVGIWECGRGWDKQGR